MGKLKPFIFGTIFGGGIAFVALQYHLIQSDQGFRLIPRSPQPSIGLAYVDVRNLSEADWMEREELANAIVANRSTDLVRTSLEGVSSTAANGSAFDKLRNAIEDGGHSFESDSSADHSGFLKIPWEDEPSNDAPNLFSDPLKDEARKKRTIALRDGALKSSPTDVARRGKLPPFEEIMSEATNRRDDAGNPSSWPQKSPNKLRSSFEAQQETESLESMLFEDNSRSSDSAVNEKDLSSGLFQDISSEVQDRAGNAVHRAGEALQYETNKAFNSTRNTIDRYVKDRVNDVLPDSVSSMPVFGDDSATTYADETQPEQDVLAPALKAIRDGFDPFIK